MRRGKAIEVKIKPMMKTEVEEATDDILYFRQRETAALEKYWAVLGRKYQAARASTSTTENLSELQKVKASVTNFNRD